MNEYDDIIQNDFGEPAEQQAQGNLALSLDDDPEKAARAIRLTQGTGMPPSVAFGNLEDYEKQQKQVMASSLLQGNSHLRDYINSNPMASKVSHDDLGQLDAVSEALKKIGGEGTVLGKMAEAFRETYGNEAALLKTSDISNRYLHDLVMATWGAVMPADTGLRLMNAAINAFAVGIGEGAERLGLEQGMARRLTRDLAILPQLAIPELTGAVKVPKVQEVLQAAERAKPWIEAGREPPVGLDEAIDKVKEDQSKLDLKNLQEATSEFAKSATRERVPELAESFAEQHVGNAKIEVSAERVAELYGTKMPSVDDGLLGWVDGIEKQMYTALPTGGSVEIPLKSWLARIEPEVARELQDDIRVRRSGMSKTEIEELKEYQQVLKVFEAYHGSPHEFEAFSMEKIGTGEGAQSYGHGLYFAENPSVASSYKTAGMGSQARITTKFGGGWLDSDTAKMVARGETKSEILYPLQWAISHMRMDGLSLEEAIVDMRQNYPHFGEGALKRAEQLLRESEPKVSAGQMYRVRIKAEKEHFLDWDKPLEQQPPGVRQALETLFKNKYPSLELKGNEAEFFKSLGIREGALGSDAYSGLAVGLSKSERGRSFAQDAEAASTALKEAGIPGIKYLDQGSRALTKADWDNRLAELEYDRNYILNHPEEAERNSGKDIVTLTSRLDDKINAAKRERELAPEKQTHNFVLFDDSLIEVLDRNGQAVRQVRSSAGLDPLAPGPREGWNWTPAQKSIKLTGEGGTFEEMPVATTPLAQVLKEVDFSKLLGGEHLKPILDQISKTAREVPVHLVTNEAFEKAQGGPVGSAKAGNAYYAWGAKGDYIVIPSSSYYSPQLPYYVLHEAVHAATAKLLDTNAKLQGQVKAVMIEVMKDALNKGMDQRHYGWTNEHEFLAEAVSNKAFQKHLSELKVSDELAKDLNLPGWRGRSLWEAFVEFIRMAFGADPQAYTGLDAALKIAERTMIEQGIETGRSLDKRVKSVGEGQLQARDRGPFDISRAPEWMTKKEAERYMELIAKQDAEDRAFQLKKAEQLERRKQTAEWMAAEDEVRGDAEADILARPDIAVAEFFRTGKLYGENSGTRHPRINPKSLTPEQLKAFPERYLRRDGMDAQDVAQLFGYLDAGSMVDHLSRLEADMAQRGHSRMREYVQELVNNETDRRMQQRFGNLEENILREAEEHVVSPTLLERLHEETVMLAERTGSELAFTKADVKKWAELRFSELPASSVSLEKHLRDAGRLGRLMEKAVLEGDFGEAYKQKQAQYLSMLLANEAKKFEKEKTRFEKVADRFSKREVKGVDQSFTDWIQKLLTDAEISGKRSAQELREAIARGDFTSLQEFVDFYRSDGWELAVHEDLVLGQQKPLEQMTVQEYRDFADSIHSLAHVGRQVKKINVAGEAMDFDAFRGDVLDRITQLPMRDKKTQGRWLWKMDAELTKLEEVFKDLDLRKELGPLFNSLIRPMVDAKHTELSMLEKLTKDLKDLGDRKWQKTLKDEIPNDFLIDPYDEAPFALTRQSMVNIMLNFGNRSNIEKFTQGYAGKADAPQLEARLRALFDQHATKADWDFVQSVWDIFEGWRKQADDLYYRLAGVPPKWIPPEPITTPHGDYAGGYFPIIYDQKKPFPARNKGVFDNNYFRATTGNSYTIERTKYTAPIQFEGTVDQIANRMFQVIHDVSFREAVMNANKVISDREIKSAIIKHYGLEYANQMEPWLKDTANLYNLHEQGLSWANSVMNRARVNLISHALGFNWGVILSPATGHTNPMDILRYENGFKANRTEVLAKSRELQHTFRNIDRDYREYLERSIMAKGFSGFRADAVRWGFKPIVAVDQFFREVTFYNEYREGIQRGLSEGEAVAVADSAVRERHGSGATVDLPKIMRTNEALKMATVFYGFFSTMYNWQRQIPGQLRRGEYMNATATAMGAIVIPSIFGGVLFNQMKESDTWGKFVMKAIGLQLFSVLPFARDLANYALEGYSARTPLSTIITSVVAEKNDLEKFIQGKPAKKAISHAANVIGLTTGLPLGQAGRTGQFAADVVRDKQRPKSIMEWLRGIRTGEAKMKK